MGGLSVIIPSYQPRPGDLEAAITSALACVGVECVVVVDDGSPMPVIDVIADSTGFARHPSVHWLRQPNAGPSAARNRGLDEVERLARIGDVSRDGSVVLLDHDDRLIPSGVAAMIALAKRLDAAGAVGARIEVWDDGSRKPKPVPEAWRDRALPSPEDIFVPKQWFGGTGLLIRGAGLARRVRFDESLAVVEDRDFLREVARVGPIAVCSQPVVEYAVRTGSSNLSSAKHATTRIRGHVRILDKHWSAASDAPLREATMWLLNAASKWGVHEDTWRMLRDAAMKRGWPVPLKARLRRLLMRGS